LSIFRRRLRPSHLPHPVIDEGTTMFLSGMAIGAVTMLALCLLAYKSGIRF